MCFNSRHFCVIINDFFYHEYTSHPDPNFWRDKQAEITMGIHLECRKFTSA